MAIMTTAQRKFWRQPRAPVRAYRPTDGGKPVAGGKRGGGAVRRTRRGRAIS